MCVCVTGAGRLGYSRVSEIVSGMLRECKSQIDPCR